MSPTYATGTSVSTESSRAEIERTLRRYGADQFAYGWDPGKAMIGFRAAGRQVRFVLPLPEQADFLLSGHRPPRRRTQDQITTAWEQACRQSWRALALIIKAKLEAVESGIVTFEDEFLAQTVLPDGRTAAEWLQPQLDAAVDAGRMPDLLPALGDGR